MSPGASTTFNPPTAATAAILAAAADASISFNDLAARHNTTPEALALWLIRPDIRERLEATDRVVTWRTRIVAANNLSAAIATLTAILNDFNRANASRARATDRGSERSVLNFTCTPTTPADSTPDQRAQLLELRHSENARRAAATLIRLAGLRPNTYARVEAAAAQSSLAPNRTPRPETSARVPWPEGSAQGHVSAEAIAHALPRPEAPAQSHASTIEPPQQQIPTPTAPPTTHPESDISPEDDQAAFHHLLSQLTELAAHNPELLTALATIASPEEPKLQPTGPPERGP